MQQHPITTYLRLLGFTLGVFLFIVMIYRTSQMVTNPIYVKGKPFLFGHAQSVGGNIGSLTTDGSLQAMQTTQVVTQPKPAQTATQNPAAPTPTTEADSKPVPAPKVTATEAAQATLNAVPGKAFGLHKHED